MPKKSRISVSFCKTNQKWQVDVSAGLSETGKRYRRYFDKKEDAEAKRTLLLNSIQETLGYAITANPATVAAAKKYDELFQLYGLSGLEQACEEYIAILERKNQSTSLGALLDSYELKNGADWSEMFRKVRWQNFRHHLEELDDTTIAVLDHDFWQSWLSRWKKDADRSPTSYNDMLGMLSMLFRLPEARKVFPESPLTDIKRLKIPHKDAVIFEPEEARSLLYHAWHHCRRDVPWYALCMFAGLRPASEIWELRWEDISFEERQIYVRASKTNKPRNVELEDNLEKWLAPFRQSSGLVCDPSGFNGRRRKFYRGELTKEKSSDEAVPLSKWSHDITRHSYASYWVAKYRDPGRLILNMGHSNMKMYEKHYKKPVASSKVKLWHGINPPEEASSIVSMAM